MPPIRTIPRFAETDAPDGPAQMDAMADVLEDAPRSARGAITSRPANPGTSNYIYGDTRGVLSVWNGTSWDEYQPRPTIVQTLPTANLYDGLQVLYRTNAMTALGVPPFLLYRLGSQWLPISVSPIVSLRSSLTTPTFSIVNAYQDDSAAAGGVGDTARFVFPITGVYWIEWAAQVGAASGRMAMRPFINVTTPIGFDSGMSAPTVETMVGVPFSYAATAGQEIRLRYASSVLGQPGSQVGANSMSAVLLAIT